MKPNPLYHWTGAVVELVELVYGLNEMKRIDDGKTVMNELAAFFGKIFGIKLDARYLYDAYTDIKHRKNDSRAYFLDKIREQLNLRMQRDDEKERERRR
ncbi:RteC domain-containing protein [Bacteroides fragilis]|uniref:RteC domain-containing protein n=1 Tax=Bacteroides fragilis TaxID=817 RepID=UPI002167E125|nr:RteC domain-containing protein [Bacteroides fragilis]